MKRIAFITLFMALSLNVISQETKNDTIVVDGDKVEILIKNNKVKIADSPKGLKINVFSITENGEVEKVLLRLGFTLTDVPDSHLCCGSAGTYALTHPDLARQLRDNKMNALESGKPEMIVTANIGCQTHLASAGRTSVRHWIEIVEQALEKE